MDQSVTRTQYDPGTIRKFKRMSCVAALLMVLLLMRGDRTGGVVERSAASPVAKSIDFDAASRDATEATDAAAAAAAQLVGTLDAARDAAVRLRGVAAAAAHKKRVADRAAAAATTLVAIGVEAPNSPAGAKYTRAAVKYTALILAFKLAALAAFALKVGPEL